MIGWEVYIILEVSRLGVYNESHGMFNTSLQFIIILIPEYPEQSEEPERRLEQH